MAAAAADGRAGAGRSVAMGCQVHRVGGAGPHAAPHMLHGNLQSAPPLLAPLPTETQRAPTQPFMRLETPTGPVVFGFSTLDERNLVVDTVAAAVAAAAAATTQQQVLLGRCALCGCWVLYGLCTRVACLRYRG